jgi:hypothetical protein
MSENGTYTATARGKAPKLLRKEAQGSVRTSGSDQGSFFSSPSHQQTEAGVATPGLQSSFFPAVHRTDQEKTQEPSAKDESTKELLVSPAKDRTVQACCEACSKEELVSPALSEEEQVQPMCDECAGEAKAVAETTARPAPAPELQKCEQCGNELVPVQARIRIGAPDDPFEKEADRMAERVMRMPLVSFAGGGVNAGGGNAGNVQRNEEDPTEEVQTKPISKIQRSSDGGMQAGAGFSSKLAAGSQGSSMADPVKTHMESAFQADFSAVRIHTGTEAAEMSSDIGAQAFAYNNHIYFNDNKYQPDSGEGRFLLAHELTHTIQQGASPAVRRDPEEEPKEESWVDKLRNSFDSVLRTMIPASVYDVVQQLRKNGILGYIKDMLFELFRGLFKMNGFSDADITLLIQLFIVLKSQLPAIIDGLAAGDCKPLFSALDLMSKVVGTIAGNMWDRLMTTIEPVRQWLINIWKTYLSPAIDKITAFAGGLWDKIKRLGRWLWDMFYTYIIKPYKDAWDWLCKKLGFGDSDEPGFLGFVSAKLSEAWENIKKDLRPVIEPVKEMIDGIQSLINMDAVRQLQEDAKKWLDEVAKTATAMGSDEDAVANKQLTLREVLLPAMNKAIDRLKQTVTAAGQWLLEKVNNVVSNINGFVSRIQADSLLSPVYALISWIPKTVSNIEDWVNDKVNFVFTKIITGIESLRKFIDPVIQMLVRIIKVAGDLLGYLPDFIMGPLWMLMPKCIKDPIMKWLTEVVLKKIPIIAEFIELTEKWESIKTAALTVIKQVFVDGQLAKGLWTFFKTLLGLLGIDATLITTIIAKAATNFSAIISKPGEFLKNVWTVVKGGFSNFWDNILIHLPKGALDWLFGEVKGAVSVAPPKLPFSVGNILGYVMDLFGISKENVYKRMELNKRIGPEKVAILRTIEKVVTGALEWLSAWINEGPEGLLRKAKEKLDDLKNMVINGVVGWITAKVSAEIVKRMATSSDPLGIGATINTIILVYDSIKAGVMYANKMLNLANKAMDNLADIIAGNVKPAIAMFEELLAKGLPIVIGFAVEVIIGPVGDKIKEIVTDARKVVDDTIDSLINGALDLIGTLVDSAKKGIKKILGWLGITTPVKAANGEEHELLFKGSEQNASLMIASANPVKYEVWIQGIDAPDSQKGAALDKVKEINTAKAKAVTEAYTDEMKEKDLRRLMDELSELTGPLFANVLPKSKEPLFASGLSAAGWGISMLADGITKNGRGKGSKPSVSNDYYSTINQRRYLGGSYYILGHILNENLGGIGSSWKNITPLTRSANSEHERIAEARVKTAVEAGNIVKYEVTAIYDRPEGTDSLESAIDGATNLEADKETIKSIIRAEKYIPTKLVCSATMKNPTRNNEETTLIPGGTVISNTLDQLPGSYSLTEKKRAEVVLEKATVAEIKSIGTIIEWDLAEKIYDACQAHGRFSYVSSMTGYKVDGKDFFTIDEQQILVKALELPHVKLYTKKTGE